MPETSINFEHLIRDIVQAYPCSLDEAVLVELVANALDAGCTNVTMEVRPLDQTFEITDDGRGMGKDEFVHYHDLAITAKQRGRGIGFAGLGAKLGVYLSGEVVTETRSGTHWAASRWFTRGQKLPWWDHIEQRTLPGSGTRVILHPPSGSPLLNLEQVERKILLHYAPLLDPYLSSIYRKAKVYPHGIAFTVNGRTITFDPIVPAHLERARHEFALTRGKRQQAFGIGYFVLSQARIPEDLQGIAVCTFGKVIRRDWFRKYPKNSERITGFVEVPRLVEAINMTKSDFLKAGAEGEQYYHFYKEMQRQFGEWLEQLGELVAQPEVTREAEKLEKLVREILAEIPEFQGLFGARTRQNVSLADPAGDPAVLQPGGIQEVAGTYGGQGPTGAVPVAPGPIEGEYLEASQEGEIKATPRPRPVRFGPHVVWADGGEERGLGWVDADNVVINRTHPAFVKAENQGVKSYHDLLSIAYALLDHRRTEEIDPLALLQRFLAAWGKM